MKCILNKKTGDIIRVEDRTADNMVGPTWAFTSKTEWRKSQGLVKETTTVVSHDLGGSVEVEVKKTKKEKKSKKVAQ